MMVSLKSPSVPLGAGFFASSSEWEAEKHSLLLDGRGRGRVTTVKKTIATWNYKWIG